MVRGFEILLFLGLIVAYSHDTRALADNSTDVCGTRDDKADAMAVDAYFVANLTEHEKNAFSRPLKESARAQAKSFLEQRIADKRAEICAAHLKLVEDLKTAPSKFATAECGSAAVVALLDQYTARVAGTFEQNQQLLVALLNDHLKNVQLKLFNIARGSSAGLDATYQGRPVASAPQEVKFEWIRQEASKLGAEARTVWAAGGAGANPLAQRNAEIGREALRAKQMRDAAKARFHSDGKPPASCKLK